MLNKKKKFGLFSALLSTIDAETKQFTKQKDRRTERQRYRKTGFQRDRDTERQKDRSTEGEKFADLCYPFNLLKSFGKNEE